MSTEYNKTIWQNGDVISVEKLNKIENGIAAVSNTVNSPAIYDTATGSIASFSDGADDLPMKSAVVNIEPIQDLRGYDSPWPAGGGKNKLDAQNIICHAETDSQYNIADYITLPAGTYTLSFNVGKAVTGTRNRPLYSAQQTVYCNEDFYTKGRKSWTFTISEETRLQFKWWGHTLSEDCTISDFMLESGSIATSYAPYSNICPISGRTGLSVVKSGKNLIPNNAQTVTKGGLTFTVNADGSVHIVGTGTGAVANRKIDLPVSLKDGETYTASGINSVSTVCRIYLQNAIGNATPSSYFSSGEKTFTKSATNNVGMYRIWVAENATVNTVIYPMIRLASDTDASYEPYKGSTYSVNWETEAGTVYGGTLDVVSGKLVVDRAMVVIDGVNNIVRENGATSTTSNAWFEGAVGKAYGRNNFISDRFTTGIGIVPGGMVGRDNLIGVEFLLPTDIPNNSTALNQWFADNPTQLCYELAEPIEIQLTPQEVRTLLGVNNVWSDAGDMAAEYPADTKLYIDRKIAEALS